MTDFSPFFSTLRDTTFVDWASVEAADYVSFVDTWYGMSDDSALWMESPWVITFLASDNNDVGDASCFMTPYWDWTESGHHKSGPASQCAAGRPGAVQDFRHRVRGKGRAIKLHYESESGLPMNLLGWSILLDRNADY